MANYLDESGLEYYDGKLKRFIGDEMTSVIARLAGAMRPKGVISTSTDFTLYTDEEVGDVYFINANGITITYVDAAGTMHSNEAVEKGDAVVCLQRHTGSTTATTSRWGALQANWNVEVPASVPSLSGTSEVTLATVGGIAIKAKLSKALGDAAAKGVSTSIPTTATDNNVPTDKAIKDYVDSTFERKNALGDAAYVDYTGDSDLEDYSDNELARAEDVVSYVSGGYVAKVSGKGLSTNDYTTAEKTKLAGISTGANASSVEWDAGEDNIMQTIDGVRTSVVSASTLKEAMSLGNVGNFKAVSTAANQGLNATEKSNARANIGLGASAVAGVNNDPEDLRNVIDPTSTDVAGAYAVATLLDEKADNLYAPAFSASESYTVGQYVTYNSKLYKCTTAHSGTWNASHFKEVTGNFVSWNNAGMVTDSGYSAADFKTKQTAKADPTASGTSDTFIATITQNANGEITATKKTVSGISESFIDSLFDDDSEGN